MFMQKPLLSSPPNQMAEAHRPLFRIPGLKLKACSFKHLMNDLSHRWIVFDRITQKRLGALVLRSLDDFINQLTGEF